MITRDLVSLFVPTLGGGGAERSMVRLAGAIADRGVRVDLVLPKAEGPNLAHVTANVRVVDLGGKRVSRALPALVGYLRRERPRGLISAMAHANLIAIWAKMLAGVSTVVVATERSCHGASNRRGAIVGTCMRPFSRRAGVLVAVSGAVADSYARSLGIARDRIEVIYNPVVTDEMLAMSREPVEHPWLQAGQPPVVLSVGRLAAIKNHRMLIEAFARVTQWHDVRLMILGEGNMRPHLGRLVRELGLGDRVALPGFWANPYPAMRAAQLFVLPSISEGLPGVLIEALACRTSVISTDIPGAREVLQGGLLGRLVPVADVAAMSDAIELELRYRPPPVGMEALARFRPEPVAERYLALMGMGEAGEQAAEARRAA